MDARDTSSCDWSLKQKRANRDLADLRVEVVTQALPLGGVRIATSESVAIRVENSLEEKTSVLGLDGHVLDSEGWHHAAAGEVGTLHAVQATLDRWAENPAELKTANLL